MKMNCILSVGLGLLTTLKSTAQFAPSTSDVWDINQGTIIILSSPLDPALSSPKPYDPRDMFGGIFGDFQAERGNIVFADGGAEESINMIQWRTRKPLSVKSFQLFAYDDP